jgi:hypothetical protein
VITPRRALADWHGLPLVKTTVAKIFARLLCFLLTKAGAQSVFSRLEASLARCRAGARGGRVILETVPRSTNTFLAFALTLNESSRPFITDPNSSK